MERFFNYFAPSILFSFIYKCCLVFNVKKTSAFDYCTKVQLFIKVAGFPPATPTFYKTSTPILSLVNELPSEDVKLTWELIWEVSRLMAMQFEHQYPYNLFNSLRNIMMYSYTDLKSYLGIKRMSKRNSNSQQGLWIEVIVETISRWNLWIAAWKWIVNQSIWLSVYGWLVLPANFWMWFSSPL